MISIDFQRRNRYFDKRFGKADKKEEELMGLGFHMTGKATRPEELVQTAQTLAKESGYGIGTGEGGMCIRLCPMGDLEVTWEEDGETPGQWLVEAECQTTPAGPGFHKAALEFAEKLGIRDAEIFDETEYVVHRDFAKMREEHFYPWLKMLVQICRKSFSEKSDGQINLCWNTNLYQPENVDRTAVTPMGRYSVESMEEILDGQGIEALAERFFLWKNEAQDALFYRNRALHTLCVQCYFALSSRSESDKKTNENILEDLERAHRMKPGLAFPYQAYREVCALDGRIPCIAEGGVEFTTPFPMGYRKGLVTIAIANLRLCLPGSYRYEWEEDEDGGGAHLWCDESVDSPIWRMSIFRSRSGQADFGGSSGHIQEPVEQDIPNGRMRYGWTKHGKKKNVCYIMECEVIAADFYYLITVTYTKPEEKEGIVSMLGRISAVPERREA